MGDDAQSKETTSFPKSTGPTPTPRNAKRNARSTRLVLSPPMPASHALVKARHRLVSTADLHLEEGGLVPIAAAVGALHAPLLRIIPGTRSAKDVLLLNTLVYTPREDGLGDVVLERTRAALESVGPAVGQGNGKDVGAVRAD